jgi:hypothetical protein
MMRLAAIIAGVVLVTAAGRADDKVVGAVWEITWTPPKGNEVTRKFRATPEGKVYNKDAKEIGTWTGTNDKATMKITDVEDDRFLGTYKMVQTRKDPPVFKGEFTNKKGREIPIKVKLVKD